MQIKLLFFATLRDRAGAKSVEIEVPEGTTVHELKEQVGREYPNLQAVMGSALVSVNREFAADEAVLPQNAEVAMFPPVSGG